MTEAIEQWQEFRRTREAELAQPRGWLTLSGFEWLSETPTEFDGLPGRWSTDGTDAFLDATATDGLTENGEIVDGRSVRTVAETSRVPWIEHGDTEIELLRRGGRLAIRMRNETSAHREAFAGVPTFDYDPDWVVTARFEPYPAGRKVDVATHKPELRQQLPAMGEVVFTLDGEEQRLIATNIKTGLSIEFHDPTNGTETEAWRQLKFDDPDADGNVTLDFNRTINMWFVFTDHATCPRPVDGNTITVPVRAGEKKAHRFES
ncbi:DUF1684 domain-containing protein [Granulicoccus sp. GXG6511]|uniref:DUF1684 domain-containing protein n=1 Tax=Granulicoccus sp. GXG6511 TaxID=3381351 RepID=UPI003D7E4BAF